MRRGKDRAEELFPEYRLQQVNEQNGSDGRIGFGFKIVTDDLALTTETAHWEIVGYRAPYEGTDYRFVFRFKNLGVSGFRFAKPEMDIRCQSEN